METSARVADWTEDMEAMAQETSALLGLMERLMRGEEVTDEAFAAESTGVYAWRLMRFEADLPLTQEQRSAMRAQAGAVWALLGETVCREDEDAIWLLLACTAFPAAAHRDTALWLCAHQLSEACYLALEQEGTLLLSLETPDPRPYLLETPPMQESSEWYQSVCPMDAMTARQHRTQLQTILKRRQYAALAGYVSRALRTEQELSRMCFAFVPLIIEAVWSQHAEVQLAQLTVGLDLREMSRKPREALLSWLAQMPEILRACPAAASQAPIERVITGIQADCSLPYSQSNLSRSLGLTPAYFCRLFHEKTGQHFSTFLTRTRMEKAQELLTPPVLGTLQEISQQCGYPNKSYFCQVFKKYTGMTPGEFEQQKKELHP